MMDYGEVVIRHSLNRKDWWWNMNNVIINYRHRGQENDLYLIHMNKKGRVDRLGCYSKIFRWR